MIERFAHLLLLLAVSLAALVLAPLVLFAPLDLTRQVGRWWELRQRASAFDGNRAETSLVIVIDGDGGKVQDWWLHHHVVLKALTAAIKQTLLTRPAIAQIAARHFCVPSHRELFNVIIAASDILLRRDSIGVLGVDRLGKGIRVARVPVNKTSNRTTLV